MPPGLRFPLARHRLHARDFRRVYAAGGRARGPLFSVAVAENALERTRLGLSVGKRCWKQAVRRNHVRRIFREAFRLSLAELPRGIDVVMIASEPRLEPALAPTRKELVRLVQRALEKHGERTTREPRPAP